MTTTWIQTKGKVMVLPYSARRDFTYMEESNVLKILEDDLPLAVLSSSAANPFAFGIINVRKSIYNHFMWMHRPGMFATQDWYYREVGIENYLGFDKRLKFWSNPDWTPQQKWDIRKRIQYWLDQPKFKTRYDVLAILGQAINKVWIQNPLTHICSDYGSILKETGVDPRYDLKHPAPDQVDDWFNNHAEYKVFGRYAGE
jgi:hypothetical protein